MGEPMVRRPDGTVVPLGTWELDGIEDQVAGLRSMIDQATQAERDGVVATEAYQTFGTRSFPNVLSLVRQLPPMIEELRAARERGRERAAEPKGVFGKYVVFKARHVDVADNGLVYRCANPDGDGSKFAEPLPGCFVLRPGNDKAARVALMFYATACEGDAPDLARDLREWAKGLG